MYTAPSNKHYLSDDFLKDKREDYQNCPVLYCVTTTIMLNYMPTHSYNQFLQLDYGACWFRLSFFLCVFLCFFIN